MKQHIHEKLIQHREKAIAWFKKKREGNAYPIYTSVDIRDASYKIAPVDANIYPAGFNNICPVDRERAPEIVQDYLDSHYGQEFKNIVLLSEEHTSNSYYWENIKALKLMIEGAGREVRVAVPRDLESTVSVKAASGDVVMVHSAHREGNKIVLSNKFTPDLIISNNDFSIAYEEWDTKLDSVKKLSLP
jgi:glutamate--cysteine ligase